MTINIIYLFILSRISSYLFSIFISLILFCLLYSLFIIDAYFLLYRQVLFRKFVLASVTRPGSNYDGCKHWQSIYPRYLGVTNQLQTITYFKMYAYWCILTTLSLFFFFFFWHNSVECISRNHTEREKKMFSTKLNSPVLFAIHVCASQFEAILHRQIPSV